MLYTLDERIILRSYRDIPFAYYEKDVSNVCRLRKAEFVALLQCDGAHDFSEDDTIRGLLEKRLIVPCPDGGRTPKPWQRLRIYDNYCFPKMNWAVTGKCNYNCRHCFEAADNAPMAAEFTWDQCLHLLDECEKCGIQTISLTGGEPTLHPHFMNIMSECARRHIRVYELITNGSFLNADMLDALHAQGHDPLIKISFDGIGHHDWMRNVKGAEERTLRAIRLAHEKGYCVKIQMNVHRGNLDTLYPTVALLDDIGIEELRVIRTSESARWVDNEGGKCLDICEYYDEMLKFVRRYIAESRHMDLDIWQFLRVLPNERQYALFPAQCNENTYSDNHPICGGNRKMVAVTCEGNVVPCLQVSGTMIHYGIEMGNIHKDELSELLNAGPYHDYVCCPVSELRKKRPECQACPWWKLCMGGCRALGFGISRGDMFGLDTTKCAYFKGGYLDKTRALFDEIGGYTNLNGLFDALETGTNAKHTDMV